MQLKSIFGSNKNIEEEDVKLSFSLSGLRGRILTVVMIPLIFLVVVAGIGIKQTNTLSASMATALSQTVPAVTTGKLLQGELKIIQSNFTLALLSKDNEDAMSNFLDKVDGALDKFETALVRYKTYEMNDMAEKLRITLLDGWAKTAGPITEARKLLIDKKFDEGKAVFQDKVKSELSAMNETLQNIELNNAETIEKTKNDGEELSKRAKMFAIAGAIIAIIFSLVVSIIVATMVSKIFARIGVSLSKSVEQMTMSAAQIASAAQQLSEATTEQAASLEETSATIEETSAMVKKNSENSRSAASTSAESQDKARAGKQVVEKMISSMGLINESNNTIMAQINESNRQIGEIVKVIQEIGNKTKVINEIVFQTKLLSFNASVEAARAGEHGKGFAVVAEEVGNLAQMSGNAAKEITDLLAGSIQKVESIVTETKSKIETLVADGKTTVQAGTMIAQQCGEVLSEIMDNVSRVSQMAEEISSASQEQSDGVHEITKAMQQLDKVTQQNATSSQESANAANDLSSQAEALRSAVGQLVSTIQGGAAPAV